MNESGGSTRYGTARTFAIILLIWGAFLPGIARAQDCNAPKQRIYRITDTEARQAPDSLQTLLGLAAFVRECQDEISLNLELWLLINEVFALDGLERYEEAASLVTHFFDVYFEEASDGYRARFYLWRLHLSALSGAVYDMVKDYAEAQQYAHALDSTRRAHLYLDGAYAYIGINEHQTALRLTQKAQDLIGTPESNEERTAMARALLLAAEAQLWLGTHLDEVKQKLRLSSTLYGTLNDTSNVAITTTLLGLTYAAEGDTSDALAELSTAVLRAQQAGSVRSQVYAAYRYGQLLRKAGNLDAAKGPLSQALDASKTLGEFHLRILYELARLYEQQLDYKQAMRFYQRVVEAPQPSGLAEEVGAALQAREGLARMGLVEQARSRTRFAVVSVLLLLVLGVGFFLFVRQRKAPVSVIEAKGNGVFIPRRLATGRTLDELVAYFREQVKVKLLSLHLAYLFATLFEPELILPYLDDPWLIKYVEQGNLPTNAALFRCIAAAEETLVKEQSFSKDPANTIRSYLDNQFKIQGWTWPTHPTEWKQYFVEHHIEHLL